MAKKQSKKPKPKAKTKATDDAEGSPSNSTPSEKKQKHAKNNRRQADRDGGDWDEAVSSHLKEQLAQLGLRIKDMTGDGNCLFRSLADQLEGNPNNHTYHRAIVCNHIQKHRDLYEGFFFDETLDQHLARMKRDGSYGENLEVVASARANKVDIAIHQAGLPVWLIKGSDFEAESPASATASPPRLIHIVYHSWEHYSSVRMIDDPGGGGPPVIQIKPSSGSVAPMFSGRDADAPPTPMEMMIMSTTGSKDLKRIREMLTKSRGDPNRVIAELFEEQDENSLENEGEGEPDADGGADADAGKVSKGENVDKLDDDGASLGPTQTLEDASVALSKEAAKSAANGLDEDTKESDDQPSTANDTTEEDTQEKDDGEQVKEKPSAKENPRPKKRVTARERKDAKCRERKENALSKKRGEPTKGVPAETNSTSSLNLADLDGMKTISI
ncbi:OTU domain-containing protein 3 [Phlyctochytrium planicorne]|nr:OTU domain-containing protein 3 [Phlyctochytrium planicorne]